MKQLIIITLVLVLTSCGGTYDLSTDYKIKSILTITEKGDTLAVPVRDFKFRILDSRVRELIDTHPFLYQYRQNWDHRNYALYPRPNYNPSIRLRLNPVKPTSVKPFKPIKPINIKPVIKPSINKKIKINE